MSDATVGLDINVNDLEALHVADAVFAETSSAELLLAGGRPTIDDKLDLTDQTERSDPTSDDEGTTWDDALLDALEEMLL